MKVLIGWELGAGQGHIQRLAALAERLQAHGWEPFFALKPHTVRGIHFPWQCVAAPPLPFTGRENSYTFADILATFGFAQVDTLWSHLQNWQNILKSIQPDLVVTDHAPGLVLACRGLIPTVVVGSHFAVPPPVEVFPAFRSSPPPESMEQQQRVSEVVRQVISLETSLGEALNGDRAFIFSIPELDIYRHYRSGSPTMEYVGIHVTPMVKTTDSEGNPPWTYLNKTYPAYNQVVNVFETESPFQSLQESLLNKSMAIHHGGLTTTVACLLSGVPQLILPRYIEQQLNGSALMRLGVAQMLLTPTEESLLQAQSRILSLISQAQKQADHFAHWNQNFLEHIVETCSQLC